MDAIAEEDEKEIPLTWWSLGKRDTAGEVTIALGKGTLHNKIKKIKYQH
jgi:hypothetical protein